MSELVTRAAIRFIVSVFFFGLAKCVPKEGSAHTCENDPAIPIIDISILRDPDATPNEMASVASAIGRSCEEIGFFVIQHHGIDAKVIENAWDVTATFFDLPLEDKSHVLMTSDYPYGYSPFGGEVLSKGAEVEANNDIQKPQNQLSLGDMKEMFAVGPYNASSGMPLPRYPLLPLDMSGAWQIYFEWMESLSWSLMRGFALALDLPVDWFESKTDHHASALRALNYPDLDGITPQPGQMRASSHTDYGVLTILRSGGPGLQVKLRDGRWHDVPLLEDSFVVNLGDLMARWTNDRWVSTPHRVVVPPNTAQNNMMSQRRQSMAFFANLNMDAEVKAIPTCVSEERVAKYQETTAGEHLMAKHLASTQGILDDSWMQSL